MFAPSDLPRRRPAPGPLFFASKWRVVSRLLSAIVSALALWLILRRLNLPLLWRTLKHLQPAWLAAACGSFGLSLLVSAGRWHGVLRELKLAAHALATVRLTFIGHFFNTLLFGPAGGDLAKCGLYARYFEFPAPPTLASAAADRLLGGLGSALVLFLALGLASSSGIFLGWRPPRVARWQVAAGLAVGVLLGWAAHRLRIRLGARIGMDRFMRTLRFALAQFRRRPGRFFLLLSLSFLSQLAYSGTLALALRSVSHHPVDWLRLLWTLPLICFISGLPVAVAGAGVREASSLVLLGACGISAQDAVACSLLTLGILSFWALAGGWVFVRQESGFRRQSRAELPRSISVVIPTLNESDSLPGTLESLRGIPQIHEVIVVDGGSGDATRELAAHAGARVLRSAKGRGLQMNVGAQQAAGDVILLLHADTRLPRDAGEAALHCLRDASVAGGGFWKTFDEPKWFMRGARFRCLLRLLLTRRVLGDQGFFFRRELLARIGGVPEMPLMEEFELARRLRAHGRLALAGATAVTSARRFHRGALRAYLRMARVTWLYYWGAPPDRLTEIYRRQD